MWWVLEGQIHAQALWRRDGRMVLQGLHGQLEGARRAHVHEGSAVAPAGEGLDLQPRVVEGVQEEAWHGRQRGPSHRQQRALRPDRVPGVPEPVARPRGRRPGPGVPRLPGGPRRGQHRGLRRLPQGRLGGAGPRRGVRGGGRRGQVELLRQAPGRLVPPAPPRERRDAALPGAPRPAAPGQRRALRRPLHGLQPPEAHRAQGAAGRRRGPRGRLQRGPDLPDGADARGPARPRLLGLEVRRRGPLLHEPGRRPRRGQAEPRRRRQRPRRPERHAAPGPPGRDGRGVTALLEP
mmetsp:Transcript_21908/g.62187  ORF Transcript_21908/g.62187 Transcript_21908/m.62187 type:complete len:293 (-) Transcript_21908:29-907(-)